MKLIRSCELIRWPSRYSVRIRALNVRRNWQNWITTNSLPVTLKLFVQNTRLSIKKASSKTYPGSAWLMLIIFPSLRCSEVVWCNLATTFAVLRLRALCVVWVSPSARRIEAIFRSQTGSHRDQRPVSTITCWYDEILASDTGSWIYFTEVLLSRKGAKAELSLTHTWRHIVTQSSRTHGLQQQLSSRTWPIFSNC